MNNMNYIANFLANLIKKDENVYLLIIDGWETYLFDEAKKSLSDEQKSRIINMGISEQNAVSVASGLALGGKTVYLIMFAAFLTSRAAEQIKLDACFNNANVKFIGIHGGITGPRIAGYSHWAIEDIATLNAFPNLKIIVPSASEKEIKHSLEYSYNTYGPMYIRLDSPGESHSITNDDIKIGKISKVISSHFPKVAIIATGGMVSKAHQAVKRIKRLGYKPTLYSAHSIKPFDTEGLQKIIKKGTPIIVMEEHSKYGGLTSIITNEIIKNNKKIRLKSFNVEQENFNKVFCSEESVNRLLNIEDLEKQIIEFISPKPNLFNLIYYIKRYFDKKNRASIQHRILGFPIFEKKTETKGKRLYYLFGIRVLKHE